MRNLKFHWKAPCRTKVCTEMKYLYSKTMFSTNFQPKYIDVKTKINQSIIISLSIYIYKVSCQSFMVQKLFFIQSSDTIFAC